MCEFLIFNTQKRYEKQKNFGNFSATFWKFSNFSATFWQLLDTFTGNFFGIHRQLVAKPIDQSLERLTVEWEVVGLFAGLVPVLRVFK